MEGRTRLKGRELRREGDLGGRRGKAGRGERRRSYK